MTADLRIVRRAQDPQGQRQTRPYQTINGKTGKDVTLTASDVGAASPAVGGLVEGTVSGAPTNQLTLPRAMAHGEEPLAIVFVGGQRQETARYTFNSTATATLDFNMAVGTKWAVYVAPIA